MSNHFSQHTNKVRNVISGMLLILLFINVLYVISGAVHFPLSHIDVWANWLYKAKALYIQDFSVQFLSAWTGEFAHPQYPIGLPYFFAKLFAIVGGTHLWLPSIVSSSIYVLILITAYTLLKHLRLSTPFALLFVYIYSMLGPVLAQGGRMHAGMPDLYIALICWLSVYFLVLSQKKVLLSWLLIPFIIVASLIKTEGVFLVILLLQVPTNWRTKATQLTLALLGFIAWQVALILLHIPSSYTSTFPTIAQLASRLIIIAIESTKEVLTNYHNWYWFWTLWFIALILNRKQLSIFQLYLTPLSQLLFLYLLMYLFSSVPITGYVTSSLDRLLLQISPLWYVPFALMYTSIIRTVSLGLKRYLDLSHNKNMSKETV